MEVLRTSADILLTCIAAIVAVGVYVLDNPIFTISVMIGLIVAVFLLRLFIKSAVVIALVVIGAVVIIFTGAYIYERMNDSSAIPSENNSEDWFDGVMDA